MAASRWTWNRQRARLVAALTVGFACGAVACASSFWLGLNLVGVLLLVANWLGWPRPEAES